MSQSVAQISLVYNRAPRCVDEVRTLLHQRERISADAPPGLVVERTVNRDEVAPRQELVDRHNLRTRDGPVAPAGHEDPHAEGAGHVSHPRPYRPSAADEADVLPGELEVPQPREARPRGPVGPAGTPQLTLLLSQRAAEGQDESHHHRGHGVRGVLRDVTHRDPPLLRSLAMDVVVARPSLADQLHRLGKRADRFRGHLQLFRHHD
mmetsp:Transcript_2260/g.8152  ORF Transcript_2260/g.8152 Transcript_2260/m.8152 type:complete len:207 (+) Transcript_2260:242-862(+)